MIGFSKTQWPFKASEYPPDATNVQLSSLLEGVGVSKGGRVEALDSWQDHPQKGAAWVHVTSVTPVAMTPIFRDPLRGVSSELA